MPIQMPDSTIVGNLPEGYYAYAGYIDGRFATAAELAKRFPKAELVLLTVTGETTGAHGARVAPGADAEPGDLTAEQAVEWVLSSTAIGERPVIYASVGEAPGYGMTDVLRIMRAEGIERQEVRLWSAHYGHGPHICGPDSCEQIGVKMDGTQYTNAAMMPNGALVDMSILLDDFFDQPLPEPPNSTETEKILRELPVVRQGDTGEAVKTVQGLCNARWADRTLAIDGVFGPQTMIVVKTLQGRAKIANDGVVGPQTWPVLLGVA